MFKDVDATLSQLQRGQPTRPLVLHGLRGVGKTVLLNLIEEEARQAKFHVISFEATDKVGLAEALVPQIQRVLGRLSLSAKAKQWALEAAHAVQEFVSQLDLAYGEMKLGVKKRDQDRQFGGSIEEHLKTTMIALGEAARAAGEPVVLLIDELQYLYLRDEGRELGALILALHRITQLSLPIGFFAAGLPQIHGIVTKLRSYSERSFQFMKVGQLKQPDAFLALQQPILDQGETIEDGALAHITAKTRGYPYFLQEYGRHVWLIAAASPITLADAERAHEAATADLDQGFFEARMQRATDRETVYLRAMARLGGGGPYDSTEVAKAMGGSVNLVSPFRNGLIKKGIIWSPRRGEVDFTVPMFDEYLRRHVP